MSSLVHGLGEVEANTTHSSNVDLMLGHRRRRGTNIKSTLDRCIRFGGVQGGKGQMRERGGEKRHQATTHIMENHTFLNTGQKR